MRTFRYFRTIALAAALALWSCSDKESNSNENTNGNTDYDESYYAANASISSSDSAFTASDGGGSVGFAYDGGTVVLNVDCGVSWTAENTASDLFSTSVDYTAGTLTVTASMNEEGRDRSATVTLLTAAKRIQFAVISITQDAYGTPVLSLDTDHWNAPAVGALTTEIGVSSSIGDFEVSTSEDWLVAEKTGSGIILTVAANEDTVERSAVATVTADDGVTAVSETVTVIQDAIAHFILSRESVSFSKKGETASIAVESSCDDWSWSYDSSNGFFSVSVSGNTLTVTSTSDNSGSDILEGYITLTTGDGAENVCELKVPVTRYPDDMPDALVLEYKVSAGTTVTLPLSGEVDCTVLWGDGSGDYVTSKRPTHTYDTDGTYQVKTVGTVTALASDSFSTKDDTNTTLTAVVQWGHTGLTDMMDAFCFCVNLGSIPTDGDGSFSAVTTFNECFRNCKALTEIPKGLFDYCTNVTSFRAVFVLCSKIVSIPAGLFDNCTKATDFYAAFEGCSSISEISEGLFANCSDVVSFEATFYECSSLKTLPNGLFKGLSKVTSFRMTFQSCTGLTTVPGDIFSGCSGVTTLYQTFYNCSALKEIPEGLLDDMTELESAERTFWKCSSIKEIPAGLFAKNTKVLYMMNLFRDCTSLTALPAGLFDNNTELLSCICLCNGCSNLTTIPDGLFDNNKKCVSGYFLFSECNLSKIPEGLFDQWTESTNYDAVFQGNGNITSVPDHLFTNSPLCTDFGYAFSRCALTAVPGDFFAACPDVTYVEYVFSTCKFEIPAELFSNNKKLTGCAGIFYNGSNFTGESPYDVLEDGTKVHLYERENYPDIYATPTRTVNCFSSCKQLTDYYDIPSSWNGGKTTSSVGDDGPIAVDETVPDEADYARVEGRR